MTESRLNLVYELLETMIDATNYVHNQIADGDLLVAMVVMEDIISGFVTIEETLFTLKLKDFNRVEQQMKSIKVSLEKIVLSFESNEYQQVASVINHSMLKQLTDLQKQLKDG
ncbi:hypothetical protein SAMN05421839_1205 [Halolactibacillus halophilus]|uniref:DUF8042 domain-containing protein n=1 Tax=Halolactibacillus halophilus TaxID=306540 RepID=A0A1I5QAG3_9BACI|nr:hypothetical protein [Halolactibacillus halophilus]GEM01714.1 hypothetical protein HHA03_12460 [Halolactibacillus halophilus]SFP43213.1 hypothetical protein SAMN05421839_1205 [Halolactibacillus halophilus]